MIGHLKITTKLWASNVMLHKIKSSMLTANWLVNITRIPRKAIFEARQAGLQPFCVTIGKRAHDYLPHIFGSSAYALIKNPAELAHKLPLLYAQLTR